MPYERFYIVCSALRILGTGRQIVCKHTGRAAKNIVLKFNTFVDRDIVLQLTAVADAHISGHIDILTQGTFLANDRAFLDMAENAKF